MMCQSGSVHVTELLLVDPTRDHKVLVQKPDSHYHFDSSVQLPNKKPVQAIYGPDLEDLHVW